MPTRARTGTRDDEWFGLPPPFRLVSLREVGDAFAHAGMHGAEMGAGTLIFVGRFDVALERQPSWLDPETAGPRL